MPFDPDFLNTEIQVQFPSGTDGAISAAKLRRVLGEMVTETDDAFNETPSTSDPNTWLGAQAFNGGATVPTRSPGDNTINAASTAYVTAAVAASTIDTSQPYTWASLQTFSSGIASVSFKDSGGTLRWDYGVSHANAWSAPNGSMLFYGNVDSACVFNFFDGATSGRTSIFSVQTAGTANNQSIYNAAAPAITGSIRGYTASLSCTGELSNYLQQNGVGSAIWDILVIGTTAANLGPYNRYGVTHPSSQTWIAGVDPNDGSGICYKIAPGGNWSTAAALKITPAGAVSIPGTFAVTGNATVAGSFTINTLGSPIQWNGGTAINCSSDGLLTFSNGAGTDFGRLRFGGNTSSFPAIKRVSTGLAIRLADDSADAPLTAGAITASVAVRTVPVAVASLPASPASGMLATVNDANSLSIGSTVAGGGSNTVLVWYNGTAWKIFAA